MTFKIRQGTGIVNGIQPFIIFDNKEDAEKLSNYLIRKSRMLHSNENKNASVLKHIIFQGMALDGKKSFLFRLTIQDMNFLKKAKIDIYESVKNALTSQGYPFWDKREPQKKKTIKNTKEADDFEQISYLTSHIKDKEL